MNVVGDVIAKATAEGVDRVIHICDPTKVTGREEKVAAIFRRDISLAFIELLRNTAHYGADPHKVMLDASYEAAAVVVSALFSSMRFYGLNRDEALKVANDGLVLAALTERIRAGLIASVEGMGE